MRKAPSQLKGLSSTRPDLVCIEALKGFIKPVEDFMARVEDEEIDGSRVRQAEEVSKAEETGGTLYGRLQDYEHALKRIAVLRQ